MTTAVAWLTAKKIDAFTDGAYGGNPAGLVVCPPTLTDAQMQAMAREMNLSETVFVAPDAVGDAEWRLRYFTPTTEVPICGHATIAALHHLHDLETTAGGDPARVFRLSTRVGVLEGHVEDGVAWTSFDRTVVKGVWDGDHPLLVDIIGGADRMAPGAQPVLFHDRNLAVEVRDVATLDRARPDLDRLRILQEGGLDGLILFTTSGCLPGVTWHQRYFAPGYGIPEDPVTGLASARIGNLLVALGRFEAGPGDTVRAQVRQGDTVGRPGSVFVRMDLDASGAVRSTRIGGRAVLTLEGRIRLPA